MASHAVDRLGVGIASVQPGHVTFYLEDRLCIREVQVVPQLITDPDPADLDPAMPLVECLRLRGEKIPGSAVRYQP